MKTDYLEYFQHTQAPLVFDNTSALVVNGTPTTGYVSAFCKVEGLDLAIELQILQTILLVFILWYQMQIKNRG